MPATATAPAACLPAGRFRTSTSPAIAGAVPGSLSASIGYRDPRGFPVYERSRIARIPAVAIDGPIARVTATTVTRFAGNREPSVEDDLIYLAAGAGRVADREAQRDALPRDRDRRHPAQVLAPP